MASFLNNFLKALAAGDNVRDYEHASRVFRDNGYDLAPKSQHLYYVLFEFNEGVRQFTDFMADQTRTYEIGVLVNQIQLPGFSVNLAEKNQYGKHTYTQTRINYNPVEITFHDDMANTITEFWSNYYKYYYADGTDRQSTANENPYKYSPDFNTNAYGYKGYTPTGESSQNFLKSVKIYSLHKKEFTEYTLVKPMIENMTHGTHASAGNTLMEHTMSLRYQSVLYGKGQVAQGTPAGFTLRYDNKPSAISTGTTSILGQGGLVGTASGIIGDLGNGNILAAGVKALQGQNAFEGVDIGRVIAEEGVGLLSDTIRNADLGTSTNNKEISVPRLLSGITGSSTNTTVSNDASATATNNTVNINGQDL